MFKNSIPTSEKKKVTIATQSNEAHLYTVGGGGWAKCSLLMSKYVMQYSYHCVQPFLILWLCMVPPALKIEVNILSTQFIHVYRMIITLKSSYFPKQQ
jgi:hypothetical protein